MRRFAWIALCCAASCLRAALPESVMEACLAPSVREQASAKRWQVLSRAEWESRPVRISEAGGITTAEQDGAEHPSGWVKTKVRLEMPPQTDEMPQPMQTLTVEARATAVLPSLTVDFYLLQQAKLPPYTVTLWHGCPALVAEAGDWYIVAGDPAAKVIKTDEPEPKTTLVLEHQRAKQGEAVSASIRVGEGPLPR